MMLKICQIIFLGLLVLNSCEYPLEEVNFIERTPPSDFAYFDISLSDQSDTIIIFKDSEIRYSIDTKGKNFITGNFTIGDIKWTIRNPQGSIFINPNYFPFGFNKLSLEFIVSSGTQSIAESLGLEGYQGQLEWTLFIENRPAPETTIRSYINDDGFLTISWSKCEQLNFDYYRLKRKMHDGYESIITFDNVDKTQWVDSCFMGKKVTYSISTNVKGDKNNGAFNSTFVEYSLSDIIFEQICVDSLKISWERLPFKVIYSFSSFENYQEYFYLRESSDTTIIIQSPTYGNNTMFKVTVEASSKKCPATFHSLIKYYQYGWRHSFGWAKLHYNSTDDVIHFMFNQSLRAVSSSNSSLLINSIDIPDHFSGIEAATSLWNTKVATSGGAKIHVFENKNYNNTHIIQLPHPKLDWYLEFTKNDEIAFQHDKKYKVYCLKQNIIVAEFPLADISLGLKYHVLSTSLDGKYVGWITNDGIKFAMREDESFNIIYDEKRWYNSLKMHPYQPDIVFVTYGDLAVIEKRKLPEFSLIETLKLESPATIRNLDPKTGYLSLSSNTRVYVLDPVDFKIVFSMRSNEQSIQLINNRLILNNFYYVDINEFINN